MKYYYIMIDKYNKTLELVTASTCYATTFEKWQKSKGLEKYNRWELETQFKLFFNNQSSIIDRDKIYKYAKNYKDITDYNNII